MTKTYYDIVFASSLTDNIDNGTKKATIRNGWRDYRPGRMLAACHENGWKSNLDISSVILTYAKNISPTVYGYNDLNHFVDSMQRYYPHFDMHSKITILEFRKV